MTSTGVVGCALGPNDGMKDVVWLGLSWDGVGVTRLVEGVAEGDGLGRFVGAADWDGAGVVALGFGGVVPDEPKVVP